MLSRTVCLILILSLSCPAHARPTALQTVQKIVNATHPAALTNLRKVEAPAAEAEGAFKKLMATRPQEVAGPIFSTLLFLFMITGLEVYRSETEARRLNSDAPQESMIKLIRVAYQHTLNSGDLYASIVGGGLAGSALYFPTKVFATWLADPKIHPLLFTAFSSTILVFGSTVGWDFGAQLWTDAAMLLKSKDDYERVSDLFGTGKGALKAIFLSSQARDQNDLRLIGKMTRNLFRILYESELRSSTISNAFRTRTMKGDFVVISAALSAAVTTTMVGTSIAPGAGSVLGLLLGVGAVFGATSLPEKNRNNITRDLYLPRERVLLGRLGTYQMELQESIRRGQNPARVEELLKSRKEVRSAYLTIHAEKLRLIFSELFNDKIPVTAGEAKEQVRRASEQLQRFYEREMEINTQLMASATNTDIGFLVAQERTGLERSSEFFNEVADELDAALAQHSGKIKYKNLSPDQQSFVDFIEVGYARGVNEEQITK